MYEADNPAANSDIAEEQGNSCNMSLTYALKNKGEIYRSYRIGITTDEEQLLTDMILYLNDTDYLIETTLPKNFNKETIKDITFEYAYEEDYYMEESMYNDIDIVNKENIYDALMRDIQEGHIIFGNIYKKNQRGLVDCGKRIGTLSVKYEHYEQELFFNEYDDDISSFDFVITDECTHVLKTLGQEERKEE